MEPVIKKVGDYEFAITPFPAFKAANLTGELASTLAPVVGAFTPLLSRAVSGGTDKGTDKGTDGASLMDLDVDEAAKALSNCSEISGDKLERLMKKLLLGGNISVKYKDEDEDEHRDKLDEDLANELFCGEVQDMFVLCVHVIQLNFNSFFKRIAAQSGPAESERKRRTTL